MDRQGVAINQQPSGGTDYPFVSPSDDVRYLLGDLYLAYRDDTGRYRLPLRITRIRGFHTPLEVRRDVVVSDADGQVVFDTADAPNTRFHDTAWGRGLRTVTWYGDDAALRCTMHTTPPAWDPGRTWGSDILPQDGRLDGRAYARMPRNVTGIRVGLSRFTDAIRLDEGFNVNLAVDPRTPVEGRRRLTRLRLRARPGDGLGRAGGCVEGDVVLRTVNKVPGTAQGDFVLSADGCTRAQRLTRITQHAPRTAVAVAPDLGEGGGTSYGLRVAELLPHTPYASELLLRNALQSTSALQLHDACSPCCECGQYIRTYEGLRGVHRRYVAVGERVGTIRGDYQAALDRWDAQRRCREASNIRFVLYAEPNCQLFVGGAYLNTTGACLQDLYLRMTFEAFVDGVATVPSDVTIKPRESVRSGSETGGSGVPFVPYGAYPVIDIPFDRCDPGDGIRFRTRLRLPCPEDANLVLRVTLTAHYADDAGVLPDTREPAPLPPPIVPPPNVGPMWPFFRPIPPPRAIITHSLPMSQTAGCGVD